MRILWFTLNPSLFNPGTNSYNGGGWTASLETIIRQEQNIRLGVAFIHSDRRSELLPYTYAPAINNTTFVRKRQQRSNDKSLSTYYRRFSP